MNWDVESVILEPSWLDSSQFVMPFDIFVPGGYVVEILLFMLDFFTAVAPVQASLLCTKQATPSFQDISSSSIVLLFLLRSSSFDPTATAMLSGESNLYGSMPAFISGSVSASELDVVP